MIPKHSNLCIYIFIIPYLNEGEKKAKVLFPRCVWERCPKKRNRTFDYKPDVGFGGDMNNYGIKGSSY